MEGNSNSDNNSTNWRPSAQVDSVCSAISNREMETNTNWRNVFPVESRKKIVRKIMGTLQRRMQINTERMGELKNIALRFEDKIYSTATSKDDYMRKISSKMFTVETKIQGQIINSLPGSSSGCDKKLLDSGTHYMQPGQVQAQPQLLSENIQSNITQSSACFASALSSIPGLSQAGISTLGAETSGMSNMSRIFQNSLNNSTGQVLSQNTLLTNSPTYHLQERQPQQQQKQTQAYHHLIYQQQFQQQPQAVLTQNLQQQSHLQPLVQQQPQLQQSFLEQKQQQQPPAQAQSPQQTMVQTAQQSIIQLSQQADQQQTAVLQPTDQSVQQPRQSSGQTTPLFALHQLQQPVHRQQQSLQHSVTQQQQAMVQEPVVQSQHQPMGKQNNVPKKQKKHHLQPIFQHPKSGNLHQTLQASQALLQPQSQQSQQQVQKYPQPQSQQLQKHPQLQSQLQSQPQQLKQQSLLQQPHSNQQDAQRLQTSDSLLQQQNTSEQSNRPSQQRGLQEVSSTSISSGQIGQLTVDLEDWQEKMYQKLQSLKETYYPEMKDLYNKFEVKCQQPLAHEELEKIKHWKISLQRMAAYFQVPKSSITKGFSEDKVLHLEKKIKEFLNLTKSQKPASQQQEGQLCLQSQTSNKQQSVQQSSQPHISQVQTLDKNVLQQQQLSSQGSLVPIQHVSAPMIQQKASVTLQKNGLNLLPSNSNAFQQQKQALVQEQDQRQHHIQARQLKELQQGEMQHPSFQQQPQQMQQPSFQQQQQQMQHQQKTHQVAQQAQINTQKTAQVQRRSDTKSEVKGKVTAAFKPASVQHQQLGQLSVYQKQPQEQQHQQFNPASSLPASSPHLQASSPQISQHFTPQIDKQSLITSSLQFPKIETPVQPADSPCVVSSPSTLPTPSTLVENVDTKSTSAVSFVSNNGSAQGLRQSVTTSANAQSLTIGRPGISASPLLGTSSHNIAQNIVGEDGSKTISPGLMTGEKPTKEAPVDRLVKMIRLMSPETFNSAVSDLRAVVSLSDSMAGSAPARRSKASVGEDLVAMTRCHLQANNLKSLDSGAAAKRVKSCMSSLPLIMSPSGVSLDDSPHQSIDLEPSEMLSTAASTAKRPRLELDRVLQLEIQDVNEQLIETMVDVSDNDIDAAAAACEGRDGIVVKCSYNAMAFGRRMDSGYKHAQKSLISPLWLLIPLSYPKCSPVVLNRPPVETIKEHEDLSFKTKAMFDVSVRNLPEPMTLGTLARTWDVCARNVVNEYAHQRGGGSFSSQYGAWENCISA